MRWLAAALCMLTVQSVAQEISLGSKNFTESYVLCELVKYGAQAKGIHVNHRQGMGGTIILWQAITSGEIAAYPEYTGTIVEEILKQPGLTSFDSITSALARFGISITKPLGFNNTYALGLQRKRAEALGIKSISDLRAHPELSYGFTHEFLGRADGWRALSKRYGLPQTNVKGLDHGLAYAAIASGEIDVMDMYSTDAKIAEYDLVALDDDLGFFPRYDAVFLYRSDADAKLVTLLESLAGTIPESSMVRMNAEAEKTKDYVRGASLYFTEQPKEVEYGLIPRTAKHLLRHVELVLLSLLLAIVIGIPLGILAYRSHRIGPIIVGFTGMIQTIPSLALLAMLVAIPFLGISIYTAIVALFLYGLLPIVRSTLTGLESIPRSLRESGAALGLPASAQLRLLYLPLASRHILSGIKTSAVINVGTATLAALIGAGGLGEPILSGLNLNDAPTILEGAIPAAGLALLVELLFHWAERIFIPKGLRIERLNAE